MTDDLYERYKETLRNGHVAVLRGSLNEAVAAYRAAAEIAPSRALPHTSLGGVYLRLGHLEEALSEFAEAVARSPHDEGALLGQAEALTAAGMRADAAAALDHVAEIQEASGRLPEAADTLRRAMELDEAVDRSRRQRALLREIRFAAGDQAAEQLLARALRLRDEPGAELRLVQAAATRIEPGAVQSIEAGSSTEEPDQVAAAGEPLDARAVEAEPAAQPAEAGSAPEPEAPAAEPEWAALVEARTPDDAVEVQAVEPDTAEGTPEVAVEPEVEPAAATAEPEAGPLAAAAAGTRPLVGVMEGVEGTVEVAPARAGRDDGTQGPTGDELLAAAEAAEKRGDDASLRSLLIWAARAYAREERFEAGLDAAQRLLARYPADVDAHLVLVELYVARSWDNLASEKLRLLDRLAQLNEDRETHDRLCAVAMRAFPNDPSLQRMCS